METIISNKNLKVQFNGSSTYFLIDNTDFCLKTFKTKRKAINYFNKTSEMLGL